MEDYMNLTHSARRKFARASIAIVVAGTLVGLAGCAASPGAATSTGPVLFYGPISTDNDRKMWESYVSLGQKVDPSLSVKIDDGPNFTDYWTKVKTRLSGSNPPCILYTQAARTQELDNLLMPLDDLIKKDKVDLTGIDKSMLKGMTVNGTLRALPYDSEPTVLFYNADRFAQAGLKAPGTTYSREQFISDAKALTSAGHYAFGISPGSAVATAWATADGASWLSKGKLDLTNPGFVKQTQQFFDLVAKDGVAKAPEAADTAESSQQAFMNGTTDMVIEGPWLYGPFASGAKFKLGVTVIPSTSGDPIGMTQGSGFGVSVKCDRPDAAIKAIAAMTSLSVLKQQAVDRAIVPARIDAVPSWAQGKTAEAATVVKALLKDARAQITTPTWNQVDTMFTQYEVDGFRGNKSAKDILSTIQNSINQ
jgi:multiple sugar transport system substrate-binding protein